MKQPSMPLCDVPLGTEVLILSMNASGSIRKRLLDLGFIEGTRLCCILKNGRSINAYLIRNTVITLRRQDSACILVTPFSDNA